MIRKTAATTYVTDPINLGASPVLLRQDPITPTEVFFVRNHAPIPAIAAGDYRLVVDGLVQQSVTLKLEELQRRFAPHTVVATLQCAGNRRRELTELQPIDATEIVWDMDAISTASWTGVRLRDLLAVVAPQPQAAHVAFLGLDHVDKIQDGFGGSIPLDKAWDGDVLLAYAMNGAPLPPTHGYPLRVIVPGYIGARSVKWVGRITVQESPSTNYYQAHAYKLFPPEVTGATVNWDEGEMLGALPINSFIISPRVGERVPTGALTVQGIALPGDAATLERVELSCDGGQTWCAATLTAPAQRWTWCFWEVTCTLPAGRHELVVRAFDSAGHTQPQHLRDVWNFKGYVNNAYHRVMLECGD
mgnify:CR=1 FL=1